MVNVERKEIHLHIVSLKTLIKLYYINIIYNIYNDEFKYVKKTFVGIHNIV
jgi:hypothetical protein